MSTQSLAGTQARNARPLEATAAAPNPLMKPARLGRSPLLSGITIEHGPVDLLGRFFLKADTAARRRDVTLSFAPMQDLVDINRGNRETWRALLPLFDPASGGITDEDSFCIVGCNAQGEVVATQAARLYRWDNTTFHDEAQSLRMFYADPRRAKRADERVDVTAPAAKRITGRVVFAGGAWYRPDYRGRKLAPILTCISRAYAYTRWKHDFHTSIMAEEVCKGGMPQRSGYTKVDWEVMLRRTVVHPDGDVRCGLTWMDSSEYFDGIADFVARFDTQVDVGVDKRRA
ncbi:MAG: hypothetical protein K2X43_04235 [Hyphomonadaceae bacterium]|jgi:hypothetical protein|nr:hypothetical protein [Hyphomonadaceae bacterium]